MSCRFRKIVLCLTAIILPATLFTSCSSSKKTTSATNDSGSKLPAKALTYEQQIELKSHYYEASKQKVLGNYDQALLLFRQCLTIDPNNAGANYEIGDIMEFNKAPDSAIVYARRAMRAAPDNVWYQDLYADCLQDKGMYKDQVNVYAGMVKAHPFVTDYYYKLAMAQLLAQQFEPAAETYKQIEEREGGFSEDLTNERIKIYERAKDYPKAELEVQRLLQHDSSQVQDYNILGDLYELEGKPDKAFETYKLLEQRQPNDPLVHLSLADYYRNGKQKDYKKSFEELELAFEQPSLDIDTKIRIVLSFYQLSNGHDSLNYQGLLLCDLMVKANPKEAKAHDLYGDFLIRNHKLPEAREQYVAAVQDDSSKYILWNKLLVLDSQLNDVAGLEQTSKDAIALFPTYPLPYWFNGFANIQKKKYDNAIDVLSRGAGYVVNDSALQSQFDAQLGDVYYYTRRYKSSDSAYDEALKVNPNDDYVLNNYSYYLSVRDTELDKAERMSKKSNFISSNNASYLDTYAWILYMEGKYSDAKYWEQKALDNSGGKDATLIDHFGDILFKLGEKDKAVENWQKAKDMGENSDLLDRKIRDKQLYDK